MTLKRLLIPLLAVAVWVIANGLAERRFDSTNRARAQATKFLAARQSSGKRDDRKGNVKAIDVRAQKSQETYIRDALELSKSYEDAGQLEKSKAMLESVLKLNNRVPGLKAKIKELNEGILNSNPADFELDTSLGWGEPRALVYKGRSFRVQAAGTYSFVVNQTLDPEGFPNEDPTKDMTSGVRCGALMGIIITNGKPGKPFPIGQENEVTPKDDGLLFLRINAPAGHKCIGKLKVQLSGYVRTP